MQTPSVRAIKLNSQDLLVFGFVREESTQADTPTTPKDIANTVKTFTPVFEPHHFLLFDIKKTKSLRFIATPAFLEENETERLPKVHTITIEPNQQPYEPIQFLRYSMQTPMRCLKNNLSEFLTTNVPSHFTSTMNHDLIAQINGVNNNHLDLIWEHFPNATFKTEFTFKIGRVVCDEEVFLEETDEIKRLLCADIDDDDEKIVDVFHGDEFLCELNGKCNFKMSWKFEHEENESFIPRFIIDVTSEKVEIDIEWDEVFFPMVKNLWEVFGLEGRCRDERNFVVLWEELGQYDSYCVQLVVRGDMFEDYEVTEEMIDGVVESLDEFEGDFRLKIVEVRCWCERE